MARIRYRFWQVWQAIGGQPTAEDIAAVRQQLPPELFHLFEVMSPSEQDHAILVWKAVKLHSLNYPSLEAAALLHDVGKTRRPLSVPDRVLIVLAKKLLPKQTQVWGQGSLSGWRGAFAVAAQHAEWGAELVESAGAALLTVELVREHQSFIPAGFSGEKAVLLQVLQLADNEN